QVAHHVMELLHLGVHDAEIADQPHLLNFQPAILSITFGLLRFHSHSTEAFYGKGKLMRERNIPSPMGLMQFEFQISTSQFTVLRSQFSKFKTVNCKLCAASSYRHRARGHGGGALELVP